MTLLRLRKRLAALLLGAVCAAAPAAHAEDLTLDAVIGATLTGRKMIRADNKVKLAQARLKQAQGVFDWRASARAGWTRLYFPRTTTVGGVRVLTDDLQTSDAIQTTTGVSRLFRNGIQIQPGISLYANTSASQAQTLGQTRPQPTLNLQIPLLQVFGDENPASANERAAGYDVLGAEFDRNATKQQATLDSTQSYWRCLAAQDEERILAADRQTAETYLLSLRKLLDQGQIEPALLERVLAREQARNTQLIKIREARNACSAELSSLLGVTAAPSLPRLDRAFIDPQTLDAAAGRMNSAALRETAYANRVDIRALEQYLAAAKARLAGARSGLSPKIDLTLDPNGVFVTMSKNLGAHAEQGAVEEAEVQVSEAEIALVELREQIGRDIDAGLAAFQNSLSAFTTVRHSDQALGKVAADSRHAAEIGGMGWDEVRTRDMEHADMAVQLSQAELDVALNLASLRLITGTIDFDGPSAPVRAAGLFRSAQF